MYWKSGEYEFGSCILLFPIFNIYYLQLEVFDIQQMEGEINPILIPPQNQETLKTQLYEMGFTQPKVSQALSLFKTKQQSLNYLLGDNKIPAQEPIKNQDEGFEDQEEDYKMIFVVRMDLKLALHKIAELTATAALRAYKQIESQVQVDQSKELAFYEWTEGGQRKIVVKSPSQKELIQLAEKAKAANINFVLVEQLPSNLKFEKVQQPSKKQAKLQKKQQKEQKAELKQQHAQSKIQEAKVPGVEKQILVLGAFGPAAENDIDPLTKHFKLL